MSTKYRKQFVSRLLAAILIIGPALSLFSSRSQASDWESSTVTIKGVSTLRFSLPKQDNAMFSRQNVPPVDVVDLENNMIYTDREPFVLVERSIDYYNWDNYYYAPVGHLKINIWLLKAPGAM